MSMGTGASARFKAIGEVNTRTPRKFDPPRDEQGKRLRVSEFYGVNTFDIQKMREKLPKEVFTKLLSTIENGKKLDQDIANTVAFFAGEESGYVTGQVIYVDGGRGLL